MDPCPCCGKTDCTRWDNMAVCARCGAFADPADRPFDDEDLCWECSYSAADRVGDAQERLKLG